MHHKNKPILPMPKVNSKLILIKFCFVISLFSCTTVNYGQYDPDKDGYIPNEATAIKIAQTVWLPIFGKRIYKEKPFTAKLEDGEIWIVTGTLKTAKGGVLVAKIQKKDGKILTVYHSK